MTAITTINAATILKQVDGLLTADVDADLVLMSIDNGKFYGLDDIGRRVWQLLAEPRPVCQVCEQLEAEYQVDRETCEREILELVGKLADANLVEAVAG